MTTKAKKISLVDFPEEMDAENGVRLYGLPNYSC